VKVVKSTACIKFIETQYWSRWKLINDFENL